jgi:hypothetical protein
MLLAPILLIPGTLFNPAVGGIGAGAKNIVANMAADPTTNQLHIAIYMLETFLLPLGVLGLAGLALRRSPWLATIGGGLGLIGWLPWAALAAQDDLTFRMAQMGGDAQLVDLWNRFTTGWAMSTCTLIYVVCTPESPTPNAITRARPIEATKRASGRKPRSPAVVPKILPN